MEIREGVQTLSMEQGVLWNKIFWIFFAVTAVKEFSSMVRNRMLLNISLLTVNSYNRLLTFDYNWFFMSFEEYLNKNAVQEKITEVIAG